jgi:hypothetical protein
MAADQAICSTQRTEPVLDSSGPEPMAPWMDDVALNVFVDAEHCPILIRLTGTLNQATAVNVVPVVGELIAAGGRDFELQTPGLRVPDGGGNAALVGVQRLVHLSGGHVTWDATTLGSRGASREARGAVRLPGSHHDTPRIPGALDSDLTEYQSDQLGEESQSSRTCRPIDRVVVGRTP